MEVEIVTEGLQFPEGPIAMADGSIILVEMRRQTLSRVWPDGRIEVVVERKVADGSCVHTTRRACQRC